MTLEELKEVGETNPYLDENYKRIVQKLIDEKEEKEE